MSYISWIAIPAAVVTGAIGTGFVMHRYFFSTVYCYERGRLEGKIAIVTGSNTGIGLETAGELARRGCTVIIACRDVKKGEMAKEKILSMYSDERCKRFQVNEMSLAEDYSSVNEAQLVVMQLDLGNLAMVTQFVQRFARTFAKVDYLICNAGRMACPYEETADGFEVQMGTNHLGHCLLVELLNAKLDKSEEPRVIMVSSMAHLFYELDIDNFIMKKENYNKYKAYSNSKLANSLYAKHLSGRSTKALVVSLHPGAVRTELQRDLNFILRFIFRLGYFFTKSPWQGCQTTMYCCLAPKTNLIPGGYYADCQPGKASSLLNDQLYADKFILNTLTMLKMTPSCSNCFA